MQNSLKPIMLQKGRAIHDICGNYLPEKVATTISEHKEKSEIEIVLLAEMDKKAPLYGDNDKKRLRKLVLSIKNAEKQRWQVT